MSTVLLGITARVRVLAFFKKNRYLLNCGCLVDLGFHMQERETMIHSMEELYEEALLTPDELKRRYTLSGGLNEAMIAWRREIASILSGASSRLLVIVGPCSVHSVEGALLYIERLSALLPRVRDRLMIVVRLFVDKPRTELGWRGLVNDPFLDGSCQVAEGLSLARALFLESCKRALPVASELLDPFVVPYLSDLISWGCIGARTATSPLHRHLAAAMPFPVGFKNTCQGDVSEAVLGAYVAQQPHTHFGVGATGKVTVRRSKGNPDAHIVLRGGYSGPNYSSDSMASAVCLLRQKGMAGRLIVDAAHGNSDRCIVKQEQIVRKLAGGALGSDSPLAGLMLESYLEGGRQSWSQQLPVSDHLSITDPCMDWSTTESVLSELYEQVALRS